MRLVLNPESEELSKLMARAWAGFAQNGNPNHSRPPHWERYSAGKKATMVFDAGKSELSFSQLMLTCHRQRSLWIQKVYVVDRLE
jgi:carboxylesterase type B